MSNEVIRPMRAFEAAWHQWLKLHEEWMEEALNAFLEPLCDLYADNEYRRVVRMLEEGSLG